jgi:phage terminase small subunit
MGEFTPRQARYVANLLRGMSKQEAARAAGVASSTIYRWHKQPEFQQAFSHAVDTLIQEVYSQLTALMPDAVRAFHDGLHHQQASVRVLTASRVVDTVLKLRVDVNLTERISQLEQKMLSEQGGTG